jgi:hypothetical protein
MNNSNFYLIKGDWYKKSTEIVGVLKLDQQRLLAVWSPKNKSKNYHLMVVSGAELPQAYCFNQDIWKTNEEVFETFYNQKMKNYTIHVHYQFQLAVKRQGEITREKTVALRA